MEECAHAELDVAKHLPADNSLVRCWVQLKGQGVSLGHEYSLEVGLQLLVEPCQVQEAVARGGRYLKGEGDATGKHGAGGVSAFRGGLRTGHAGGGMEGASEGAGGGARPVAGEQQGRE